MAKAHGATMSSWNGFGDPSNIEKIYLHAYKTVAKAWAGIGRYLAFYNSCRPHSLLDRNTPDPAYFNTLSEKSAAA